jgi:hypothetical protein
MENMNENAPHYIDCDGTIIRSYSINGNCSSVSGPDSSNLTAELPTGAVPNSLFSTVDWITSATSWIGDQISTITQVLMAPYNILKMIPLFSETVYAPFAAIIGIMWWAISFFLIVAWIFGR